jgi:hypothetical protein
MLLLVIVVLGYIGRAFVCASHKIMRLVNAKA